jgi:hypothetical protein
MTAMKYLLLLLLIAGPANAQSATPNFTSGSMTQTTNATQTVTEVIAIERFGGEVTTWNGDNVKAVDANGAATNILDTGTTFQIIDDTQPWQLEVITRAAGVVETEDVNRTINLTTTVNTLSIFSQ